MKLFKLFLVMLGYLSIQSTLCMEPGSIEGLQGAPQAQEAICRRIFHDTIEDDDSITTVERVSDPLTGFYMNRQHTVSKPKKGFADFLKPVFVGLIVGGGICGCYLLYKKYSISQVHK